MLLQLLNGADTALSAAYYAGVGLDFDSVEYGSSAGFTPDPSRTGSVNPVYTSNSSTIYYNIISPQEITFVLIIEHDIQALSGVGNMVLYLKDSSGTKIPFLMGVLPGALPKSTDALSQGIVGDRLTFCMTLWFPKLTQVINLASCGGELYARLKSINTSAAVDNFGGNEYVCNSVFTYTKSLSILIQDQVGNWWGCPFSQNMAAITEQSFITTGLAPAALNYLADIGLGPITVLNAIQGTPYTVVNTPPASLPANEVQFLNNSLIFSADNIGNPIFISYYYRNPEFGRIDGGSL